VNARGPKLRVAGP